MNAKSLWMTGAAATGLALLTFAGGAGSQPDAYNQLRERCREAGREMADLHREIQGIEMRLDKAQKAMTDAKGTDARLDAVVTAVNQMADERTLITQKIMAYDELLAGHTMEHLTATGDAGKKALEDCPVYKTVRATATRMENTSDRTAPPKKK
jgi:hypothetical protein